MGVIMGRRWNGFRLTRPREGEDDVDEDADGEGEGARVERRGVDMVAETLV